MHRTATYRILKGRRKDLARLDKVLEMCRQLYNAALQERRNAWAKAGKSISYFDQCKELTGLRDEDAMWKALNAQMVRYTVLLRVRDAFKGFFRRAKAGEKPVAACLDMRYIYRHGTPIKIRQRRTTAPCARVSGRRKHDEVGQLLQLLFQNNSYDLKKAWNQVASSLSFATAAESHRRCHQKSVENRQDDSTYAREEALQGSQTTDESSAIGFSQPWLEWREKAGSGQEWCRLLRLRAHAGASFTKRQVHQVCSRTPTCDGKIPWSLFAGNGSGAPQEWSKARQSYRKPTSRNYGGSSWKNPLPALQPLVPYPLKGTTQRCSSCGTTVRKGLGDRWHSCGACGLEMDRDENAAKNILRGAVGADGFAP